MDAMSCVHYPDQAFDATSMIQPASANSTSMIQPGSANSTSMIQPAHTSSHDDPVKIIGTPPHHPKEFSKEQHLQVIRDVFQTGVEFIIREQTYTVEKELGAGGFGIVFRVRGKDGHAVAAKILYNMCTEARGSIIIEVLVSSLLHKSSAKFMPALKSVGEATFRHEAAISHSRVGQRFLAILMEEARNCENQCGTLREELRLGVARDRAALISLIIASMLNILHGIGLVHQDLKPDNILMDAEGLPLLADFGSTSSCESWPLFPHSLSGEAERPIMPCTPQYTPPEVMIHGSQVVTKKFDSWAWALITLELFGMKLPRDPWNRAGELHELIQACAKDSARFRELLSSCLCERPSDRPDLSKVNEVLNADIDKAIAQRERPPSMNDEGENSWLVELQAFELLCDDSNPKLQSYCWQHLANHYIGIGLLPKGAYICSPRTIALQCLRLCTAPQMWFPVRLLW